MVIDVVRFYNTHQIGEHATHPIARFLGHWSLLLLLAWDGHAASYPQGAGRSCKAAEAATDSLSRLAQQPKKRTLGCVQLPNPG